MVTNHPGEAHQTFKGPWHGDSQIVIGIDIGTTFSGVSYAFLQKGSEQRLYSVAQWPGQQYSDGNAKIPTQIWYDSDGKATAIGAEAVTAKTKRDAGARGWRLAKEFKLHLHPLNLRREHDIKVRELPDNVSLDKIYSDFLRYLLEHTKPRFEETVGDGKKAWENYRSSAVFVIAHPNGWGLAEQKFLRDAAVAAGLASSASAATHVRFVTEAEASVHFCMHSTSLENCLDIGKNFVVCDAGGSTVDTTLYTVHEKQPKLRLGEVKGSACIQAGAIFVNDKAEDHLRKLLGKPSAKLAEKQVNELVSKGLENFETQAKRQFGTSTNQDEIYIEVAGESFENLELDIQSGIVPLDSADVRSFFDPCVEEILKSVKLLVSSTDIKYLVLVGGFGANPYLQHRLKAQFQATECQIMIPSKAPSKAVADGVVIWHAANSVFKRAPRYAYGTDYVTSFDPNNPEHSGRKTYESHAGTRVDGAWAEIVPKDIPIECDAVSRHTFGRVYPTPIPPLWGTISDDIYASDFGGLSNWLTNKSGELNDGFRKVCTITGKLGDMTGALALGMDRRSGSCCWVLEYDVCIRFGRTEIEAFMEWEEEGVKKTGPATVLPISKVEKGR